MLRLPTVDIVVTGYRRPPSRVIDLDDVCPELGEGPAQGGASEDDAQVQYAHPLQRSPQEPLRRRLAGRTGVGIQLG